MKHNIILIVFIAICMPQLSSAQTGTESEPISYVGGEVCNPRLHEGGLRYAIGVENIQVLRANRTHPEEAEGYGWTYNHAPNITHWKGHFYVQYLSNPMDEQQPPGQTLLVTSADGRNWGKPIVAFPPYEAPAGVAFPEGYYGYIMHQRMGFYTAPNGRLLTVAFYGHSYSPFKEGGIGRVVREVYQDGSLGPIYFIRYTSHAQWNASNTSYPFYTESPDEGFREACSALLADKLRTLQWIDEDRGLDGFYSLKDSINRVQATNYYHRPDGKVVGLWKWSYAALSPDNGLSWSVPVRIPSLIMAGGKLWGQRTADGRFALCYNPIETQPYRYPLIALTSEDGIRFDSMAVVHGEVPPRRFMGENKDFGPCYVRGIVEGEEQPDNENMWLTYSVNKEDIWVARVPLPIRTTWHGSVSGDFQYAAAGAPVPNWNIYRSKWCDARLNAAHHLLLTDKDPYDYARAIRVFEQGERMHAAITLSVNAESDTPFEINVTDRHGTIALSLQLLHGRISTVGLQENVVVGQYEVGKPLTLSISLDVKQGIAVSTKNAESVFVPLLHAVKDVERLSLCTGEYRNLPNRQTPNQDPVPPLPGCDEPTAQSEYEIYNVEIN